MAMLGLTDAPILTIEHESLGMLDHIQALSEFIRTCQTPLTISFQGDWGSGKTSMMNMVRGSFKNHQIETRWFNTWQFAQFQMQDDIAISLLTAFLDELGESGQKARGIANAVGRMAAKQLGRFVKAGTDLTLGFAGDETKGAMDKLHDLIAGRSDSAKQLTNLKEEISLAVEEVLKKSNAQRMVVFIDDLDRLVPMRAVEILETIKLFLDVPKCVFVLAVDYQVVSKGLEAKFGVGMGDLKGKSFFDKIIQLPFNLPVAQYNIRQYVNTLFSGTLFTGDEDLEILVNLAEFSIGTNPRSLKRLFNTLQLLLIVAKNKSMLEADGIATAKERQRILFAVLCLQLAYEPIYSLLLKNIAKNLIDTNYLDTLSDAGSLRTNAELLPLVTKALPLSHDPIEAFERFTSFMGAFKNAIQLNSDKLDESQEVVSESELDLLRQFLFLSSLTSTVGASVNQPGTFRHKATLLTFVEKTLKPKYQVSLTKINSVIAAEFKERSAHIGFLYSLGALKFGIWISWDDNRGLSSGIWEETGGDKRLVRNWFEVNIVSAGTSWDLKRTYGYGTFETKAFESAFVDDNVRLQDYQAMVVRTLDLALTKLVSFYLEKHMEIEKLVNFNSNLIQSLSQAFPSAEGWTIDSNPARLGPDFFLKVHHSDWSGRFSLVLGSGGSMMRTTYVGIRRTKYKGGFGGAERLIFTDCKENYFPEEKRSSYTSQDNWYIFLQYLPQLASQPFVVELDKNVYNFAFNEPETQKMAVDLIAERISRFKQLMPQLKELAGAAED